MSEKKREKKTQSVQTPVDRMELRKRILSEREAAFHALSKY